MYGYSVRFIWAIFILFIVLEYVLTTYITEFYPIYEIVIIKFNKNHTPINL
jgi:hypothetical protein